MGDGDVHNHNQLPIVVAGGGGGTMTPGRHVVLDEEIPMCNLDVSMINRMGVPTDRFGDSHGHLEEI